MMTWNDIFNSVAMRNFKPTIDNANPP
jgi:hypothetical protein